MILTNFKATNYFMKYYFPFAISTVVCLLKAVVSIPHTPINIDHILRRHGIIPDVIDVAPKFVINISYKRNESLRMGYKVDPAGMQHVPRIEWPTKAGVFYTILMIDPDVPVRKNPSVAQRQHWVVGNIPRNDPHQGETITEYIGPISPKNSGLHRTTFLVYSQNGHINFTDEPRISLQDRSSIKYRYKFSAKKFAERYNLTLFAVNFFRTGWPLYGVTQMTGPTRSPNNSIRGHFEPSPELLKV